MLKWLAVPALLVAVILPVNGQEEGSQAARRQKGRNRVTNPVSNTIPAPPLVVIVPVVNHPESYLHRLLSPENIPSIGLFVAGIVGIIVAIRTLIAIKRQADLMERQTVAAAKSTAAFINKERSRVFIRAEVADDFCATFHAVNRGLSPARITYGFVGCEIFSNKEKFSEIPDYTGDDPAWIFGQNEWVLPKQESMIGDYRADYISATENPELFKSVMSGEDRVWFYGVVRYSDSVSEDEHEVRFCYKTGIRDDGSLYISPDGPEAYRREA